MFKKIKIHNSVLFIILLFLTSRYALAQKNSVYGTLGIYTALSYERVLSHNETKGNKLVARVSGGKIYQFFYASDDSYNWKQLGLSISGLLGNNRSFFEFGSGLAHLWERRNNEEDFTRIIINVNLGFRYEEERFLFRVGTGIPELGGVSIGFRF